NRAERTYTPPCLIATDVSGFPCVIKRRLQYGQNAIGSSSPLANAVGRSIHAPVIWLLSGLRPRKCRFLGKIVMPTLNSLGRQLGDLKRTKRRQDVRLDCPSCVIPGLTAATLQSLLIISNRIRDCERAGTRVVPFLAP